MRILQVGHKNEGNIKDLRLLRSDPNSIEKVKNNRVFFFPENVNFISQIDEYVDEEMVEINAHINKLKKLKNENYGEVVRCTIFHEHVLKQVQKNFLRTFSFKNFFLSDLQKKSKTFSEGQYLRNSSRHASSSA